MLHTCLLALLAAWSLPQLPAPALTYEARAALNQALVRRLVEIRRRVPPAPGIIVPGDSATLAQGFALARNRVLTASLLVEGWPQGPQDVLEVRQGGGPWQPAAVGLMDARVGLAVLDCEVTVEREAVPAVDVVLRPGGQVFAAGVIQPVDVRVGLPGPDPFTWYWRVLGAELPIGTPLVDHQGRLASWVGAPGLMVPRQAVDELVRRRPDWLP